MYSVRRQKRIMTKKTIEGYYGVLVRFEKRNGLTFDKRFKSRVSASRAVRAWRTRGGKVLKIN